MSQPGRAPGGNVLCNPITSTLTSGPSDRRSAMVCSRHNAPTLRGREGPSLRMAGGKSAKEARMQDAGCRTRQCICRERRACSSHELAGQKIERWLLSLKPADKLLACHLSSAARNPYQSTAITTLHLGSSASTSVTSSSFVELPRGRSET